jgi:hypothetical protein
LTQTSRPDSLPATRLASPDLPFMPVGSPDDSDSSDASQSPRSPRASRRGSPRKAGPTAPGLGRSGSASGRPFLPPGMADSRGDFKINGAAGGGVGGGSTSSASSMSVSPEKRTHPLPSTSLGNDAAAGPSSSWSSAGLAPPPGAAPALGRRDSAYSALAAGGSAPAESPASSSNPSALHPTLGGSTAAGAGGAGPTPPSWLTSALDSLRSKYTSDRFDLRAKAPPPPPAPGAPAPPSGSGGVEWRIKCLDCPGKLYTPGPGESLTNFEVHIKNRVHRGAVSARVEKEKERERAQGAGN